MRIAQAQGPDFLARALDGHERVVIGNPVAAILTEGAGRCVLAQHGDNPKNLPVERVEPLGVQSHGPLPLARPRVSHAEVHHAPVRIAGPGRRIERDFVERMKEPRHLHPQHFTRRPLERGVAALPVRPLDQDHVARAHRIGHQGRRQRRRGRVARQIQPGKNPALRACTLARRIGILHVKRVEDAVARVVRIEREVHETGRESLRGRELRKEPRAIARPVEVQVGRELLRLLVEDVERDRSGR